MDLKFNEMMCWANTSSYLTSFRIERGKSCKGVRVYPTHNLKSTLWVQSQLRVSQLTASVLQPASWNALEVPSLQSLETEDLPLRNMHRVIQMEHNVLSLIVLWRSRLCHRLCQECSKEGDDFRELTAGMRGLETFL